MTFDMKVGLIEFVDMMAQKMVPKKAGYTVVYWGDSMVDQKAVMI